MSYSIYTIVRLPKLPVAIYKSPTPCMPKY